MKLFSRAFSNAFDIHDDPHLTAAPVHVVYPEVIKPMVRGHIEKRTHIPMVVEKPRVASVAAVPSQPGVVFHRRCN